MTTMDTQQNLRMLQAINYDALINKIKIDGFAILKNVFTPEEIETYRLECSHQFDRAPRLEGKNYIEKVTPNYTQPWSINYEAHKIASYRLYEFYHNPMSPNTKHIVDTVVSIRDRIEGHWPEIQEYNKAKDFHDYNIVAKYARESGFQSKHSDLDPSVPFPTVQCQIMLSRYGDDYTGGHLRFYGYDGTLTELHKDVPVSVGDLILFDKRLPHDVTETKTGTGSNQGRWIALIGAKTFPRSESRLFRDAKIKLRRSVAIHAPFVYNALKSVLGDKPKDTY